MFRPSLTIACAVLCVALAVPPWHADLRVESVGARQGLGSGIVSTVYVDDEGFLWCATQRGLVRFDGYATRMYSHDPDDPASLSDNIVRAIHQDREGTLWLGTLSGGLDRFDAATETFTHFRHDPAEARSLSNDGVYAIVEDRDGGFWVGTENGLNRFDPATAGFERFFDDTTVNAILEDGDGTLWIGTSAGLNRRDPKTGRFERFAHDPEEPQSIDHDFVMSLDADEHGTLWIGTATGLNRLERGETRFRRYTAMFETLGGPTMVSALASRPGDRLWVGTFGHGLIELDTATGAFAAEPATGAGSGDGSPERVIALHVTEDAVVAATWGGGLKRVRFDAVPISTVSPNAGTGGPLDVTAILPETDGSLWLTVYGGGLRRRGPGAENFEAMDASTQEPFAIARGRNGVIWYGGGGGLVRYDTRTGTAETFLNDAADPRTIGAGFVTALLEDTDGRLWVGTNAGGVQRRDNDGGFSRFVHDPADPASIGGDYVTVLLEDAGGTLWVGTSGGGLNACERDTMRCERYLPDPDDPRSLDMADVSAVLQDRQGKIWVGTAGGSIGRLDVDGFERFPDVEGLVRDGVRGLLEDDDGSLWYATRNGLVRFDPATGRTRNIGIEDGLTSTDFHHGSAARGPTRLHFGSPKGLVTVPAGTPFPDPLPSPTAITGIRTLQGPLPDSGTGELLRVPHGKVLSVEFAVLDIDARQRHRYQYRMLGVTDDWIDLGKQRNLTFTDLRPATFTLEIRGRNARRVWSATTLSLEVVPPFWMTWWFRSGAIGLLVLVSISLYYLRVSSLERRNAELERLYADRRSLTQRLEASEELERKRIARELHDEMGQVLSAAKISLQMLPDLPDGEARTRQVEDTVKLIDDLLSQVRALSLDLSPPFLEELGLGPALEGYLERVGERAGLDIRVEHAPDLRVDDPAVTISAFRLVQESTTNVVRHAEAAHVEVRLYRTSGWLEAQVRDDGSGFDVDRALERSRRGLHLGLLGMLGRVDSLGGEMKIESRPGAGTEIRFRLPLA